VGVVGGGQEDELCGAAVLGEGQTAPYRAQRVQELFQHPAVGNYEFRYNPNFLKLRISHTVMLGCVNSMKTGSIGTEVFYVGDPNRFYSDPAF